MFRTNDSTFSMLAADSHIRRPGLLDLAIQREQAVSRQSTEPRKARKRRNARKERCQAHTVVAKVEKCS